MISRSQIDEARRLSFAPISNCQAMLRCTTIVGIGCTTKAPRNNIIICDITLVGLAGSMRADGVKGVLHGGRAMPRLVQRILRAWLPEHVVSALKHLQHLLHAQHRTAVRNPPLHLQLPPRHDEPPAQNCLNGGGRTAGGVGRCCSNRAHCLGRVEAVLAAHESGLRVIRAQQSGAARAWPQFWLMACNPVAMSVYLAPAHYHDV